MDKRTLGIALTLTFGLTVSTEGTATPITAGLQLWLDAFDGTTLLDEAGLRPGDGGFSGSVAMWADKSSSARHATSALDQRPTYSADAMSGKPSVLFNGGQYFELASPVTTTEETIFLVTRMFDSGDNRGPWLGNSAAGQGHGVPGSFFNDDNRYFIGTSDGLFGFPRESAPTSDTLVIETRGAGVAEISENTTDVPPRKGVVVSDLYAPGSVSIDTIGWFPFGNRTFFGEISEVLVYDRVLSDDETLTVMSYVDEKYGLGLLPDPTAAEVLAVDFGELTDVPLQPGYVGWSGPHQGDPMAYNETRVFPVVFGAGSEVAVTVQSDGMFFRDYQDIVGGPFAGDTALLSDNILRNSPGAITLKFAGLLDGDYSIITYHHDTSGGSGVAPFDIVLSDSLGSDRTIFSGLDTSGGSEAPSDVLTVTFPFTVVGGSEVVIAFDGEAQPGNHMAMNGFRLVGPSSAVSEPATLALLGLGLSSLGFMRGRQS